MMDLPVRGAISGSLYILEFGLLISESKRFEHLRFEFWIYLEFSVWDLGFLQPVSCILFLLCVLRGLI